MHPVLPISQAAIRQPAPQIKKVPYEDELTPLQHTKLDGLVINRVRFVPKMPGYPTLEYCPQDIIKFIQKGIRGLEFFLIGSSADLDEEDPIDTDFLVEISHPNFYAVRAVMLAVITEHPNFDPKFHDTDPRMIIKAYFDDFALFDGGAFYEYTGGISFIFFDKDKHQRSSVSIQDGIQVSLLRKKMRISFGGDFVDNERDFKSALAAYLSDDDYINDPQNVRDLVWRLGLRQTKGRAVKEANCKLGIEKAKKENGFVRLAKFQNKHYIDEVGRMVYFFNLVSFDPHDEQWCQNTGHASLSLEQREKERFVAQMITEHPKIAPIVSNVMKAIFFGEWVCKNEHVTFTEKRKHAFLNSNYQISLKHGKKTYYLHLDPKETPVVLFGYLFKDLPFLKEFIQKHYPLGCMDELIKILGFQPWFNSDHLLKRVFKLMMGEKAIAGWQRYCPLEDRRPLLLHLNMCKEIANQINEKDLTAYIKLAMQYLFESINTSDPLKLNYFIAAIENKVYSKNISQFSKLLERLVVVLTPRIVANYLRTPNLELIKDTYILYRARRKQLSIANRNIILDELIGCYPRLDPIEQFRLQKWVINLVKFCQKRKYSPPSLLKVLHSLLLLNSHTLSFVYREIYRIISSSKMSDKILLPFLVNVAKIRSKKQRSLICLIVSKLPKYRPHLFELLMEYNEGEIAKRISEMIYKHFNNDTFKLLLEMLKTKARNQIAPKFSKNAVFLLKKSEKGQEAIQIKFIQHLFEVDIPNSSFGGPELDAAIIEVLTKTVGKIDISKVLLLMLQKEYIKLINDQSLTALLEACHLSGRKEYLPFISQAIAQTYGRKAHIGMVNYLQTFCNKHSDLQHYMSAADILNGQLDQLLKDTSGDELAQVHECMIQIYTKTGQPDNLIKASEILRKGPFVSKPSELYLYVLHGFLEHPSKDYTNEMGEALQRVLQKLYEDVFDDIEEKELSEFYHKAIYALILHASEFSETLWMDYVRHRGMKADGKMVVELIGTISSDDELFANQLIMTYHEAMKRFLSNDALQLFEKFVRKMIVNRSKQALKFLSSLSKGKKDIASQLVEAMEKFDEMIPIANVLKPEVLIEQVPVFVMAATDFFDSNVERHIDCVMQMLNRLLDTSNFDVSLLKTPLQKWIHFLSFSSHPKACQMLEQCTQIVLRMEEVDCQLLNQIGMKFIFEDIGSNKKSILVDQYVEHLQGYLKQYPARYYAIMPLLANLCISSSLFAMLMKSLAGSPIIKRKGLDVVKKMALESPGALIAMVRDTELLKGKEFAGLLKEFDIHPMILEMGKQVTFYQRKEQFTQAISDQAIVVLGDIALSFLQAYCQVSEQTKKRDKAKEREEFVNTLKLFKVISGVFQKLLSGEALEAFEKRRKSLIHLKPLASDKENIGAGDRKG